LSIWYGLLLYPFPGSQVTTMREFGLSVPVRFSALMPGIEKPTAYGRPLDHLYTPESCQLLIARPSALLSVYDFNW